MQNKQQIEDDFQKFLEQEGLSYWYKFSIKAGQVLLWAILGGSILLFIVALIQIIL